MKITLSDVTIRSKKVQEHLLAYLDRVGAYKNHDNNMSMTVYCDNKRDFTAVESDDYQLCFASSAHKMRDTITSIIEVEPTTFAELRSHVSALLKMPVRSGAKA